MLVLSFDVTDYTSVALSEDNKIIASKCFYNKQFSEQLINLIEDLLIISNKDFSNIDYISLTNGPGSFTGIRVGLAVAKGILVAESRIKVAVFSNFEVINHYLRKHVKCFDYCVIVMKSYNDSDLYLQIFKQDEFYGTANFASIKDTIEIILKLNGRIVCGGTGLLVIYKELEKSNNIILILLSSYVKIDNLVRLTFSKIKSNYYSDKLVPLYIKQPSVFPN